MKNRTIYFEGLGLVEGHFSGVGQYILGILRGVDEILEQKKLSGADIPIVKVIIPYDQVPRFDSYQFRHIRHKRFPLPFRIMAPLHHRDMLPPIDLWCGKGLYIFTRFAAMPLLFSKYAVVVYDLSFELFRQYSDEGNAIFLSKRTKSAVAGAEKVIAISNNSKQELIKVYKTPADKIVIATPAADQRHFYRRDQNDIDRVKYKYKLEGDYILSLSNLEPRKNLDGLINAYRQLPKKTQKSVGLLLVGVNGWKIEGLLKKILLLVGGGTNIMRPASYVDDLDKPALISGAKMLVYPSHYEGFGMPPLEALACGTPVITSDNSSLPEVVGDTGIKINSTDTDDIQASIQRVLDDSNIQKKTIVDGPKRAEQFSWEKSASVYLELFEKIK